ncbi:MAG: Cell surface protein [Acidobacteriales bacterium]|nr:Cell surface protein [Terriglobales bacterium]
MFRKFAPVVSRLFASSVVFAGLLSVSLTSFAQAKSPAAQAKPASGTVKPQQPANKAKLSAAMAKMPLAFEANSGQQDAQVKFLSRGSGYTLFLTQSEAVLALAAGKNSADVVRVKLAGANRNAHINAVERLGWDSNYFIGNDRKKWRTHVANYRKVQFDDIYPGVQLVYYGNQQQLEHDFIVAPGADPKKIAMEIAGAKELVVDERGTLVIKTKSGELRFEKPVIYQDVNGSHQQVAGNFVLRGKKSVGFEVAAYDRSKALVIDPVLNYSTYLSGVNGSDATAIYVDGSQQAFVTGKTLDTTFPVAATATFGSIAPLTQNGFVVEFDSTGTTLVSNAFFGGNNSVSPHGITVEGGGNVWIGGDTTATDFPTAGTNTAYQAIPASAGSQGFVIGLSSDFSTLLYGTYVGGANGGGTNIYGFNFVNGLAYLTGTTADTAFPVSAGGFQSAIAGTGDAVVAVIDPTAGVGGLYYGTYIGGTGNFERANAVLATCAPEGAGCGRDFIYFAGVTDSSDFPTYPAGAAQNTFVGAGAKHGFAVKLDPSSALVTSGAASQSCNAGVVTLTTAAAHHFVVGEEVTVSGVAVGTGGTDFGFAATKVVVIGVGANAINYNLPGNPVDCNGFATDDSAGGGTIYGGLLYSTFIGGTDGSESVFALSVDQLGSAYVAGQTNSTNLPVAVGNAIQPLGFAGGSNDAFITKINPDGTGFDYSAYIGGSGNDVARSLVVDGTDGLAWVGGTTTSPNFPVLNAYQSTLLGTTNSFVTSINAAGNALNYSTYLGGSGNDQLAGMSLDYLAVPEVVYLAGSTTSADFPTTGSAFQAAPLAANSAFVAKLTGSNTALTTPLSIVASVPTVDPIGVSPQAGPIAYANQTTYTFTIQNTDAVNGATGVHFDFLIPGGAALPQLSVVSATPSAGSCSPSTAGGVSCDLGSLDPTGGADTVTVDITVTATQAGGCFTANACTASTIVSTAKASAFEGNSANSTTETSNVIPVTSLSVALVGNGNNSATSDKYVEQQDSTLKYIATVTNAGPNTANNVTVSITTVPPNFTLTGPGGCTQVGGVGTQIDCANIIASIGASTNQTVTITGTIPALAANVPTANVGDAVSTIATTSVINNGTVMSNTSKVVQERVAPLTVTALPSPQTVQQVVGALSYTVTAHNAGPSDATNVRLKMTFTTGLAVDFTSVNATDGAAGCTLNPGKATLNLLGGGRNANVVTLSTSQAYSFLINTATRTTNVVTVQTTAPHGFTVGNSVHVVGVTTFGPSYDGTFIITGTPAPDQFTYAQVAADDLSGSGGTAATLAVGDTVTIAGTPAGGLTAQSADGTYVITATPTTSSFEFTQVGGDDYAGIGGGFGPGGTATLQADINCLSTAPIASGADYVVTLTGTAPATINGNVAPPTVTFTNTAIADTFPVSAVVDVAGTPQTPVSTTFDTIIERQSDLSVGAVTATAGPVQLTGATNVALDVTAGSSNTNYSIPSAVVSFTLTPTAPATQFTTFPVVDGSTTGASCVVAGAAPAATAVINCTVTNLSNAGQLIHLVTSTPITDNVSVGTVASAAFTTKACISGTGSVTVASDPGDGCAGGSNNLSTTAGADPSTTIRRTTDLDVTTVSLAGAPNPVSVSGPLTYTYSIKNNGPDTALNVLSTITHTSSAITTPLVVLAPTNATCVINGSDVNCSVASLASGATVNITVPITPPLLTSMTGPTATNTDTLGATANLGTQVASYDSTAGNNASNTISTTIKRQADLDITTVSLAGAPNPVSLAGPLTYTYSIKNNGPDTALNVNSTIVHTSTAIASALLVGTPTNATCAINANNVDCSVASIANGATVVVTVPITPPVLTAMTGPTAASSGALGATATLAGQVSTTDTTAGNNASNAISTTLQRQSDLDVTTVALAGAPGTVSLSGPLTYTYTIKNNGPDAALNVKSTITHTSTAVTTPLAVLVPTNATCAINGNNVDCSVASLGVGASVAITVPITPPLLTAMTGPTAAGSGALGATINLGPQVSTVDGVAGNNTSNTISSTIQRQADLDFTTVSLAGAPNPVSVSGPLTYTYSIKNNGPDTALNVVSTITHTSTAVTTPLAVLAPINATCAINGNNVDCSVASIANGATVNVTVPITPPLLTSMTGASAANTDVLGATAALGTQVSTVDPNAVNDSTNSISTTIERQADLDITTVSLVGSPSPVSLSGPLTYTYSIKNNGPDTALNVLSTIAHTSTPVTTSLLVGSPTNATCAINGTNVDCSVASIANGATVNITLPITPPVLTSMTGAGAVATDLLGATANLGTQVSTTDTTAGNNGSNTISTTLRRTANIDLATPTFNATSSAVAYAPNVTSTAVTTNLTAPMTLNFGVHNIGPDTALNVPVLLTNLGAGLGAASGISSTAGSTCVASGNNIQCTVASVASGATSNIVVTFTPSTPTGMTLGGGSSPTGSFTSTQSVSPAPTSYFDGTAANDANAQTVTTNLQRQSDLQLQFAGNSFTGTPGSVDLTAQLTFTYNFKNNGPDPALNTKSRLTFTSGPVTTPFQFVAAGSTVDIGGGPGALAAAANNGCVAASSTQLDCEIDGPIPVGTSPGFVVKVSPPLTTFMSGGGASDAMTVGAQVGSISVVDDAGAPAANNISPFTIGISIQRISDLAINSMTETPFTAAPASSGLGNPFVVTRDSTIHYDMVIQNNGPSDATNVVLTVNVAAGSTLPGGLPGACGAGSGFAGSTITCNYGSLAVAAGAVPITFIVTPPALAANSPSVVLAGAASIGSASVNDTTNTNNSGSAPTTQERDINLSIPVMTETPFTSAPASSGLGNPFVDGRDSTIHYDLQIQNIGPSDATNVVLTVAVAPGSSLPGGLPGACGGGSGFAGSTITCNIGNLAVGGPQSVPFVITPPALGANTALTVLPASASLNTSPLSGNNLSGNSANAAATTQERDVNLVIPTMTVTPFTSVPAASGTSFVITRDSTLHYVLGLSNGGLSSANARLTVNIAAGSTLNAPIPAGCALGGSTITCDIVLAGGSTPTYTFIVTPPALVGASTTLQATATLVMTPGNAANNASSNSGNNVTITQERDADLGITLVQAPAQIQPVIIGPTFNSPISWIVGATNAGPSDATNVTVTSTLVQGLVFDAVNSSGACSAVGSAVTCNFGTVAIGATPTLTIVAKAGPTTLPNGQASGSVAMSAAIASTTIVDPGPTSNQSTTVNTNIIGEADVNVVSLTATPNPVFVGDQVTYVLTINNIGPHPTQPLTVNNTLPTGVTIASVSSPTFTCPAAAMPCTLNQLASGSTGVITIVGNVNSGAVPALGFQTMTDTASVGSNIEDPVAGNNSKTLAGSPSAFANTPTCTAGTCSAITLVNPEGAANAGIAVLPSGSAPGQSATITFNAVTVKGGSSLVLSPASCVVTAGSVYAGTIPLGYRAGTFACGIGAPAATFYDVSTTAQTTGAAKVCVNVNGDTFRKIERVRMIQIFANGSTADITASSAAPNVCGNLPALTKASGTLRVAVMEPSNAAPTAAGTGTVTTNGVGLGGGLVVNLDASLSTDGDGPDTCNIGTGACSDTLSYSWSSSAFVNSPVLGKTAVVAITATGSFTVTLTVTDQLGASSTFPITLSATATGGGGGTTTFTPFVSNSNVGKGQSASFGIPIIAPGGGVVTVTGSPSLTTAQITCSISPAVLSPSATAQTVTILCSTQGQIFGKLAPPNFGGEGSPVLAGILGIASLPLLGMLLVPGKSRRRKLMRMWGIFGLMLLMVVFQAACGGGGSGFGGAPKLLNAGTPAGTYTLTLGLPAGATPGTVTIDTLGNTGPAPLTYTLVVQ